MTKNFITFEGPDKVGKTTQYHHTLDYLTSRGIDFVTVREPGGTPVSERVRELLLHPDYNLEDMTELLLYEAARAELVGKTIKPSLKSGKIVVCDRYTDSSTAYQGYGRGLGYELVRTLNDIATEGIYPGLTLLYLDRVASKDNTRLEQVGKEFDERVMNGYLEIAKKEPERVKIVRARRGETAEECIRRTFGEGTLSYVKEFLGI